MTEEKAHVDFTSFSLMQWLHDNHYDDFASVLSDELDINTLDDAIFMSQADLETLLQSLRASNCSCISNMSLKQQIQLKSDFFNLIQNYKQYKQHLHHYKHYQQQYEQPS